MKRIISLFTAHPASVGETYLQHLVSAFGFSSRMMTASICCFIHGLMPFLFVRTGSKAVTELHDRMVVNRSRDAARSRPNSPQGAVDPSARPQQPVRLSRGVASRSQWC